MTPRFRLYFLALILLTWIPVIHAQQPKSLHRIAILRVGKPPDPFIDAFRQGLQEMGYTEGQNIVIEYRWLQREDQLNDAAEELVRLPVDIIVATTTPAALAAKRANAMDPNYRSGYGRPYWQWIGEDFRSSWRQCDGSHQPGSGAMAQTFGTATGNRAEASSCSDVVEHE